MTSRIRIWVRVWVWVGLICAGNASAQQVTVRGYGEADLSDKLRSAIASNPIIFTRDTVVSPDDTMRANVLVINARLIVEGTIAGDLTGVGANIYLRPPAVVTGRVLNVAGGLYPSELAQAGSLEDRPLAPYRVVVDGNNFVIEGMVSRPAIKWLGGAQIPEYNRVDGLRAEVGPTILLPPIAGLEPSITGSIGYATEREDVLARAHIKFRRYRSSFTLGWEDNLSQTNEEWIRSGLSNSLSFVWNGKDYRNYYQADRTFAEFRRVLERGERTTQYWLRAQNELARPLAVGDPFVIVKPDSIRSNPLVPASRIESLVVGARTQRRDSTSAWDVQGALEFSEDFNAYATTIAYAMQAIANHTLRVTANFRGPLPGTDSLPRQRWTFVGGSGTLYTFDIAQFPGDRLAFLETDYKIPFPPRYRLRVLGTPAIRLLHNIGMAWAQSQDYDFEQNVGARLQFTFAYVRFLVNPRNGDSKFSAGVSMPSKTYPWEKRKPRRNPLR